LRSEHGPAFPRRIAAATRPKIAVCDTSACTFGLKLYAEVSQTAIMEPAVTAGSRHREHRARSVRKPARCRAGRIHSHSTSTADYG